MSAARDPREIITPDAFSVASELLGRPLARPWRRGVAMLIDLVAITIVGALGWLFVGVALAFLFFRKAFTATGDFLSKGWRRIAFGSVGTLILAATVAGGWISCFGEGESDLGTRAATQVLSGLGTAGGSVSDVFVLLRTDSEAEFREAAEQFVSRMAAQEVSQQEIRQALQEIAAERDAPWARRVVREVLATIEAAETVDVTAGADSLAIAYAAAIEQRDSVRAEMLRGPLVQTLAADQLGELEERIAGLRRENRELEEALEREREEGLIRLILQVADEVGIGFGWAAFYFVFFPVVWKGCTLGKRLLGIRVLRLDGRPLGWWVSFNRFGGYAASLFTGLAGFFEMFWDANRQALQDRIAWTVVVKD